ncbi:MAG: hypothetical protein U9R66_13950 [Thermodesulfobacteriota bacterium]|nr:hypothetical protein [Thermodesulfobacteriota bacterium]
MPDVPCRDEDYQLHQQISAGGDSEISEERDFEILEHLGLWEEKIRPPPNPPPESPLEETNTDEPFDDGWPGYEEQFISVR